MSESLRLLSKRPRLGASSVAIEQLELYPVGRGCSGHIQASAASSSYEFELAVAQRHGLPLLIRAAAKLPGLN